MKLKKIFLIFGIAGSGKSTLAKNLAKEIKGDWINADMVRSKFKDWDFSRKGILRQSGRMRDLALKSKKQNVVLDLICPFEKGRKTINADYYVWVDTIKKSRFRKKRIEKIFQIPKKYDVKVSSKNSKLWTKIILDQQKEYKWSDQNSTALMLGRYQPFHKGHERLFEKCLERVDQVLIAVKNVHGIGDNPFKFSQIKKTINKCLYKNFKSRYKIISFPNVTNIFYGRKVGYNLEKINLEKTIQNISGTKIRKYLRKIKKLNSN